MELEIRRGGRLRLEGKDEGTTEEEGRDRLICRKLSTTEGDRFCLVEEALEKQRLIGGFGLLK